jgi:hypothetical protein
MQRHGKLVELDGTIKVMLRYLRCPLESRFLHRTLYGRRRPRSNCRARLGKIVIIVRPWSRILQVRRHILEEVVKTYQRDQSQCDSLHVPSMGPVGNPSMLPGDPERTFGAWFVVIVPFAQFLIAGEQPRWERHYAPFPRSSSLMLTRQMPCESQVDRKSRRCSIVERAGRISSELVLGDDRLGGVFC